MTDRKQKKRPAKQQYIRQKRPSKVSRFFRNGLKYGALALLHILYRMKFIGEERTPLSGPGFIVCNHVSYFDIPVIFWKIKPWVYFVAKHDLLDKPILGPVMKWWEAIPINRDQPGVASVRDIMGHIRMDHIVAIFPEGTRVKSKADRTKHPAKDGVLHFAYKLNAPIIPMAIDGNFKVGTKLTVIMGQPFFLRPPEDTGDRTAIRQQAKQLMEYIYNLIEHPDQIIPPRELVLPESEWTPQQRAVMKKVQFGQQGGS
ncbi:MAG TPA: 1-acyl-sn-glycerol-3-phosphate acyltransferase [Clostridiaceae bacterium]|nr:1-acyl-sn-glycerol-3-phosphate acyltransferase [Clostridiaceae bacterium]